MLDVSNHIVVSSCRPPIKVHLTGGEGAGWALDQDFDNTREALLRLENIVELVGLEDADVIHTVWDQALDRIDSRQVEGKTVVCHICTNVFKMLESASYISRSQKVSFWVTQTGEANKAAQNLKWPSFFVPYAFNTEIFKAQDSNGESRNVERMHLGIMPHEFVIGNFMRDSLGADLNQPKPEKGADVFLEVVSQLKLKGFPVHILLAGPRRHWLRGQLVDRKIPFTFIGRVTAEDDIKVNILPLDKIASLYQIIDLCLITSRYEGGPRAVLEAAALRIPVLSTQVGLAIDVLHPSSLFSSIKQGVQKLETVIAKGYDPSLLEAQYNSVIDTHSINAVSAQFAGMYAAISASSRNKISLTRYSLAKEVTTQPQSKIKQLVKRGIACIRKKTPGIGVKICLWHEFHKPPYGGGNQFMMALKKGLKELGVEVVSNQVDDSVDAHICNAVWFGPELLEKLSEGNKFKIIHRLDGLVHVARGLADKSIDEKAYQFNKQYATATVMQSEWCLKQAIGMGYKPVNHVIIKNASDPKIFFPDKTVRYKREKIRLIASSWSDNPMKGTGFYKGLENELDWTKFDFTFVGRTQESFKHIRIVPPLPSSRLAKILRQHDIYITASRNEACSNALIEALSCGLPTLFLNDSSNPEVVGWGGVPFDGESDMLSKLYELAEYIESHRGCIRSDSLQDVAMRYLLLAKEVISI